MTRTFTYTFDHPYKNDDGTWDVKQITLKKRVTDRMEERNTHKAGYAAGCFNDILRSQYGYHISPVTAWKIQEVRA